jgi:putative ABC transport system permease protein
MRLNLTKYAPPKLAQWLLKQIVCSDIRHRVMGDFFEIYSSIARDRSKFIAQIWYWSQVVISFPGFIKDMVYWRLTMFKNYYKTAFRHLFKYRFHSLINISGLSIGMACCILIFVYIQYEFSYDRFHEKYDQIYRITTDHCSSNGDIIFSCSESPIQMALGALKEFPEVRQIARLSKGGGAVSYNDVKFLEGPFYHTTQTFLQIFDFPINEGLNEELLKNPYSVVITKMIKEKYFGDETPVGKILNINKKDYKVTGIFEDIPENSHLQFVLLANTPNKEKSSFVFDDKWVNAGGYTYITLPQNYPYKKFEEKLNLFVKEHTDRNVRSMNKFHVQPLSEIHLYSDLDQGIASKGEAKTVFILALISIFILLVACINFINLSMGLSTTRLKEVGIRKIIGARKSQLVKQFVGEIICVCFLAIIIALLLAEIMQPVFGDLLNKDLSIYFNSITIFTLISLVLVSGLISGIFPSLVLSSFKPVEILSSKLKIGGTNFFNRILIVIQFSLSGLLIISAIIMSKQLDFTRTKYLGFNEENIFVIPIKNRSSHINNWQILDNLKNELEPYQNIIKVTGSAYHINNSAGMMGAFGIQFDGSEIVSAYMGIDYNYFETFGIKIKEGRNFSQQFPSDVKKSVIVNETFINELNISDPIGKKVRGREIIGIVEDFHFEPLYNKITPLMMTVDLPILFVSIRIHPEDIPATVSLIKSKWKKVAPSLPFQYSFYETDTAIYYSEDEKFKSIVRHSSVFLIFISSLGVLGITGLSINRRRKEISIRKVFGASTIKIFRLMSEEYMRLIIIGNIICWPIAYLVLNSWLKDFTYKINIGVYSFLLAFFITLGLAIIIVSSQIFRSSIKNPIDELRYE